MIAPHNLEAEAGVIGAALMAPSIVARLVIDEALSPDHFYVPAHQALWLAVLELHDAGQAADEVSVAARSGQPTTGVLAAASPVAAIREHARIVKHDALRRCWQTAGSQLIEAAGSDNEQLVAQAEATLRAPTVSDDTASPAAIGDTAYQWIEDTTTVGIATGFPALDNHLGGGLRPGDMTALGAWTGMGKSCLVDQILADAAVCGRRCHAYINEMSITDRALRMIARATRVPFSKLVVRDLTPEQHKEALKACGTIPFGLTDCSQWSGDQVARHIRANGWDLCALDLVHNMPYERQSELHRIVSTIVAAARSSGSHLILVCHFNEARATTEILPRPVARDIRDSGMIKNLATNVVLLHRDQRSEAGLVFTTNTGVICIDKARHGQKGGAAVEFDPDRMRFWPAVKSVREAA